VPKSNAIQPPSKAQPNIKVVTNW